VELGKTEEGCGANRCGATGKNFIMSSPEEAGVLRS